MSAAVLSRRDLSFLLHEWLAVEELCDRPAYEHASREVFDDVLELAERVATERFAPHNRTGDEHEPHVGPDGRVVLVPEVAQALDAFAQAGLLGASLPDAVGGMALPQVVQSAAFAWFLGANVGTSGYPFLTLAAANMLVEHGSREQVERWVKPMVEGRYFGTMCLSETQAGSSLADITTRAEPQADGTFRLTGTKMWISGGEHDLAENIVHLVLAKIPGGPAGVKGISLFIVPRSLVEADGSLGERNDIVLAGLNHKMGYRGTVNTVLGFGEGAHAPAGRAGAVGYLVGQPHHGLAYMFHMMNEARIGVGLGAAAIGHAGYAKAARYALERPQGRLAGDHDRTGPQVPIVEHPDVRRMLLAQKSLVEGAFGLVLYAARLVDEQCTAHDAAEREHASLLLDVLTPIVKSWPSQWCLEANSLAIQVLGGYGYARDYEVEQHYRDNRLNPIHEGTHGIQALDLLGRKMTMRGGVGLDVLVGAMRETTGRARAAGDEAAELADRLEVAVVGLERVTRKLSALPDRELALANATVHLEAAGHVAVAWMWLEQWLALRPDGSFYDAKRQAARYFYRFELPRVEAQLRLLDGLDRTVLDAQPEHFAISTAALGASS